MKLLQFFNKTFKWVGVLKKFSQSLEIFLEYAETCKDEINKIWVNSPEFVNSNKEVLNKETLKD